MKAKLVLISPDADGKEFKLALPTKIGRGQEAKLKLLHPLVSRVHCEIYEQGEQLMVRDMASLNGTFVDDERVADEMVLPSGCRLTVGSAQFQVLYGDDYDRPPPARPAVRSDAPTKLADETVPMNAAPSDAEPTAGAEDQDDPWDPGAPAGAGSDSHGDTRTLDFDFLSDDEPAKPAPKPAAKSVPAKPAAATAKPAAKPARGAKPATPARPPNPAEFADEEEIANSARPFTATSRTPAAPAPAAQAPTPPAPTPPAGESDEAPATPAESGSQDDEDLDDFFRSIM